MYFSVQNYAPSNPRPYDDTGWTFQYMRNLVIKPITDKSALGQPMAAVTADVKAPGGIEGSGPVLILDHTTDSNLVTFRFRHKDVAMEAAEDEFDAGSRHFRAGAFIIKSANRAVLEPTLTSLGLSAWAVAAAPAVRTHSLDVPRIGYVHSWSSTQNEGWVRAAFDTYGVPYTYFGDTMLRAGSLRQKYDVIVYPHVGGSAESQVNGLSKTAGAPLPYRKTADTPNLGALDQADDIRGGMGWEGLMELAKFVREGGTLLTEGSTSTIFPEYNISSGVTVENPEGLFVRGSILRGVFTDRRSPIAYGYDAQVPVYFNQDPVLSVGGGAGRGGGGGEAAIPGVGMNVTPMAAQTNRITPFELDATDAAVQPGASQAGGRGSRGAPDGGAGGRGGRGRGAVFGGIGGGGPESPRIVLAFPPNPDDMLLSGVLVGGQALANRAQVVDIPVGQGHVVSFAIRPYWRWQTQGTFFLGFNTILNWNDLDAGKVAPRPESTQ